MSFLEYTTIEFSMTTETYYEEPEMMEKYETELESEWQSDENDLDYVYEPASDEYSDYEY